MVNRLLKWFFLTMATIFSVAGCSRDPDLFTHESKPLIMAYPYEMPADRKKAFVDLIKSLRAGQSYNEVVKLLGPPDSEEGISAKEHNRSLGWHIRYYLKKKGDAVNEVYDQSVALDFGNRDGLNLVLVQNLPDLVDQIRNLPVAWSNCNGGEIESGFKPSDQRERGKEKGAGKE
jgi:hypothetical protein